MATACPFAPCCSFHPPTLSSRLRRHFSGPSSVTHHRRRPFLYTSRKGVTALQIPPTRHSNIASHDFQNSRVSSVIRGRHVYMSVSQQPSLSYGQVSVTVIRGRHVYMSASQQPSLSYGQVSVTSDKVSGWDAENRKLSLERMCNTFHNHLVHGPSDAVRDPSVDRESMCSETVAGDPDYLKKVLGQAVSLPSPTGQSQGNRGHHFSGREKGPDYLKKDLGHVVSLPSPPGQSQGTGGQHFSGREKGPAPPRVYLPKTANGTIGLNGSVAHKNFGDIKEPIHNAFGGRHDDERRSPSPEIMRSQMVAGDPDYLKKVLGRVVSLPSPPRQSQGTGGHHFSGREKGPASPRVCSPKTASGTIGPNGSVAHKNFGDIKEPIHNAFGGRHADERRSPSPEIMRSETVAGDHTYLKKVLDRVVSLPSPPRQSQGTGGHHFSGREKGPAPPRVYSPQTASGTTGLNGSVAHKNFGDIKEPTHNAFGGRHDDESRSPTPEIIRSETVAGDCPYLKKVLDRVVSLSSPPRQSQGTGGHHFSSREKGHAPPRVYSPQTASGTTGLNGSLAHKHFGDIKEPTHNAFGGRRDDERRSSSPENADVRSTCAAETTSFNERTDMEYHEVGTKKNYDKETFLQEWVVGEGNQQEKLIRIYDRVLLVDNFLIAKEVVRMLTTKYKDCIHACDTEVANINVKEETPVAHGEIICFSIYSGAHVDFGNGKSCIWVDVLDGGRDVLMEFAPFFENPSIKKVWHNYSFDSHVIENYGINISGFYADTMHLARLWDSSRRLDGGYSLEALTSDNKVMSRKSRPSEPIIEKISMKSIFGKKKVKKDGSEGKLITIPSVEHLQREERKSWICYSALDSMSTLELFNSLKEKLMDMEWFREGVHRGTMYDFYEEYWRPFGALLVKMESEGMLVDRAYLSEIEKVAISEQRLAADQFRKWASTYCADAMYMNVGSDAQLRQLFFGGIQNRNDQNETLPVERGFKVPNTENVIEEGKKTPSKYRTITIRKIGNGMKTEMYTPSGWPSISGDTLKAFAGKIPTEQIFLMNDKHEFHSDNNKESSSNANNETSVNMDASIYGTAYDSFEGGVKGKEACHAIAALCEVCSIDSLISNFILPLQGDDICGRNGRVHCSLNINTETGRLSARRPNLQNQPALEKDRYKIRQAFIAAPGNSLIVADYGQLELRILAHLTKCTSMLDAFKAGGDFHSRTAMNMYEHVRKAVEEKWVLLEWHPQFGEDKSPVPLLKDAFAVERRKAKMLNFSIAYGKTPIGLSRDWKVSVKEAKETVKLWYKERKEVLKWQEERKKEAREKQYVDTLLGRSRRFPSVANVSNAQRGHIERAAINAPVQGSAADVAMCAMLEIDRNTQLKELGWKLLLQVHDEVILEGPADSAETAKAIVVDCMSKPFYGKNILKVGLSVDAKCAQNWYAAK